MTPPFRFCFPLLLAVTVAGCRHSCGERPPLMSRLRSQPPAVVPASSPTRPVDRFRQSAPPAGCCDDALPPPGVTGFGQPTGGGFVSQLSGMPYSSPLPTGGFPASPSYPYGGPIQIGPPGSPDDQLPPPGYTIPSPGVPLAPPKSTNDVRAFPPLGGGIPTGDPKKR